MWARPTVRFFWRPGLIMPKHHRGNDRVIEGSRGYHSKNILPQYTPALFVTWHINAHHH